MTPTPTPTTAAPFVQSICNMLQRHHTAITPDEWEYMSRVITTAMEQARQAGMREGLVHASERCFLTKDLWKSPKVIEFAMDRVKEFTDTADALRAEAP